VSFVAVGSAGGGGPTVIVTVAVFEERPPVSRTMYLNVATPWNPAAGVNVTTPLTGAETVPIEAGGGWISETLDGSMSLSGGGSTSFASRSIVTGVANVVTALSFPAIGAGLNGKTFTVTVAGFDGWPAESRTMYWNAIVPTNPAGEVYAMRPSGRGVAVCPVGSVFGTICTVLATNAPLSLLSTLISLSTPLLADVASLSAIGGIELP
jgi:hypothetical protein